MRLTLGGDPKHTLDVKLEVFDFDKRDNWKRVLRVARRPLVLRALDAGMKALCKEKKQRWSRIHCRPPKPMRPRWYRKIAECHVLSVWEAAVGSLLYPDYEWLVAYTFRKRNVQYSAAVGLNDVDKSVIVMDILKGYHALRKYRERELLKLLLRQPSFAYPVEDAIARLEAGRGLRFSV